MDKELKDELEEKLGAEEAQKRIKDKVGEYHGLITPDSAGYLVSLEVFGPRARTATLLQARASLTPVKVRVRVERVFPPKTYEKAGKASCTERASVSDHSGTGTLVCYDEAARPLSEEIAAGDLVEASPVRFRGDEYHLAQNGTLSVAQKGKRAKIAGSDGIGVFEGEITRWFGNMPYQKKGNETPGTMASFEISDASGTARVVWWESPEFSQALPVGTRIIVENGVRRGGEIHITAAGRLVYGKGQEKENPKIEKIEVKGGGAVEIKAGEIEFSLDENAACIRMGAGMPPAGVSAKTIIELKTPSWIGKPLPNSWIPKD